MMKLFFKIALAVILIAVGYISYIALRLHLAKPRAIAGITVHSIKSNQRFNAPKDACTIGNREFVILQHSSTIYEIRNDSLVAFCGENGNGDLQFLSPHILEHTKDRIAVLDITNRVIQTIDTTENFVSSIPKKDTAERLFPEKLFGNNLISNMAVKANHIVYAFSEPGKYDSIYEYNFKTKSNTKLKIQTRHTTFLELLPDSNFVLYDGLNKTLSLYTLAGQLLNVIGNISDSSYGFNRVIDIEPDAKGYIYLLQTGVDEKKNHSGYKIDVFSSGLDFITSIKGDNKSIFFQPEVINPLNHKHELKVYNRNMDRCYVVDLNHFINHDRLQD